MKLNTLLKKLSLLHISHGDAEVHVILTRITVEDLSPAKATPKEIKDILIEREGQPKAVVIII